jgi:hypothetical protein
VITGPVQIQVRGLEQVRMNLRRRQRDLADFRPFWPRLQQMVGDWMRQQFETEGRWGGDPWRPLSGEYLERKQREYPGTGILVRTGELRRAAESPRIAGASPGGVRIVIPDAVAPYHQTGTRTMPARPIIPSPLPEDARAEMRRAFHAYVRARLAGSTGGIAAWGV